ncbi:MAG: hypothetical protein JWR08_281 [Enterovirga sp.]|jgi:uncharacterized protein YjlB|nr:hypothetical protein [Enterovirga sp.]
MRGAVRPGADDPALPFEQAFRANGWTGTWRNGIFPYDHFHSTAHEVLGLASGAAQIAFGGPEGEVVDVEAGDVIVVPAGVAHRLVAEHGRVLVVGGYAGGRSWDIVRPTSRDLQAARGRIAAVPLPDSDPVHGPDGPLLAFWQEPRS